MQARRRAQPSGTNSPSSSHPRLKHRARCVIFFRARHAAARVAPVKGYLAGSNTEEPRGSAPRERDHRGGDHPVPSRTRQLSPPSPRVLQRKAAGGQGVALAEGAFLMRAGRRHRAGPAHGMRREGPQGVSPLRASPRLRPPNCAGTPRFCGASARHCRRVLAASSGKPPKGFLRSRTCLMTDDREPRTAAYRAPEGPQGGCSPRGPLRVLGPPRGFRAACAISADHACRGPPGGAVPAGPSCVRALRACSVLRCMRSV